MTSIARRFPFAFSLMIAGGAGAGGAGGGAGGWDDDVGGAVGTTAGVGCGVGCAARGDVVGLGSAGCGDGSGATSACCCGAPCASSRTSSRRMRSSCPAIASRRWRLSSSSFACTPAKSSRAARSASTSCGSEAPLTPSQAARPPSPAPLEEPISMAAAGSAAAVMRARDHVPVQPSRKPNAMTSAPITHEKAATMSGTRIEPSAATIGPSASETTSSGRHMKRFIVAITLPAPSVALAARPTSAYGITRKAEKGTPSSAMFARARPWLESEERFRSTTRWRSSQARKTRISPRPTESDGMTNARPSVTQDAPSIPNDDARAPSL
mmetsp:Transcript_23362/g.61681  ORF Transcript_23362/g.61681 Transcript_23362/m.61681 type:complete len:325 (-) Transcript_23362:964-1938(-)